jgi:hypothetical protein
MFLGDQCVILSSIFQMCRHFVFLFWLWLSQYPLFVDDSTENQNPNECCKEHLSSECLFLIKLLSDSAVLFLAVHKIVLVTMKNL